MAYLVKVSFSAPHFPLIDFESLPLGRLPALRYGRFSPAKDVPARGILTSRHKRLSDLFTTEGTPTVCQAFRDMVEELEPGIHQFFPFEIVRKNGRQVEGRGPFYLFNILNNFDSLIVDKSDVHWKSLEVDGGEGKTRVVRYVSVDLGTPHLTLSARAIAGRHLWRADQLPPNDASSFYISDELMRRKTAAKLRGFQFTHLDEVDEDWDPEENLKP